MPIPSIQAGFHTTNRLILDELVYDASQESSRFERLVIGLNSNQYHAY